MTGKAEGVNLHEWLDEHIEVLKNGFYFRETRETALGIANLLKRMTGENHCMTLETRRKLGFALDKARENVIAGQPIANIIGIVENTIRLMLWKRGAAVYLSGNIRNLSRYVIEGRSTKPDDILIEAGRVKDMLNEEDMLKCDMCNKSNCKKRKEK